MKAFTCTALGLVLAAGLGYAQDPPADPGEKKGGPAGAGLGEELDKATAKAGAMTNYSCTITVRTEGMGGEGQEQQSIELQVQPGAAWHLKAGDFEAFKKGDTLAAKEGAAWKRLDKSAKQAIALSVVRGAHETLRELKSSSFKALKRDDSESGRCYAGELTEAALRQLDQGGRGGDRSLPKPSGNAKIWVSGDGAVTKFEVYIESKMKSADNQEVMVKRMITAEIRDIGTTKYDVPPEAAKALEG